MLPNHLFNQTLTIYNKTSYDQYGREVVGSGTDVQGRLIIKTLSRLLPNGQTVQIEAIAYVPTGTTVNANDRVTYGSDNYKVHGKYAPVDRNGNINHIKIELAKWQTT